MWLFSSFSKQIKLIISFVAIEFSEHSYDSNAYNRFCATKTFGLVLWYFELFSKYPLKISYFSEEQPEKICHILDTRNYFRNLIIFSEIRKKQNNISFFSSSCTHIIFQVQKLLELLKVLSLLVSCIWLPCEDIY